MSGFDIAKASGMGTSTINRDVLGMPFITIIQKGSPEFDETHKDYAAKHIENCRPGNFLFEPERMILEQPLELIPLAQTTHYTEWKPNKGGFMGNHPLSVVSDRNYRRGQKGTKTEYKEYLGQNELIYTILVAVLFKAGSKWKKGLISFTGTQLKHARNWSKGILGVKYAELPDVQPPMFAALYKATTRAEQNSEGGWFGWNIQKDRVFDLKADQEILELAFEAGSAAIASLPKPESQKALTQGEEVMQDDKPY